MATDVVMPQMGESIAEGTIVRWIKKVGDTVDRDEPLFEISTDKVDAEIPSPAAGVVSEIRVKEGETVPVNSVVAVIGAGRATAAAAAGSARRPRPPTPPSRRRPTPQAATPAPPSRRSRAAPAPPAERAGAGACSRSRDGRAASAPAARRRRRADQRQRRDARPKKRSAQRSSPLVRKIAKEHNVDISQIHGTGIAGRVTKDDILGFIGQEGRKAAGQAAPDRQERRRGQARRPQRRRPARRLRRRRSSSRAPPITSRRCR